MSQAKHTPGPWTATGRSVNAEASDRNICVVRFAGDAAANARLIAAAPAMLEALKVAAAYMAALPQFPDRGFDVASITNECKAAIAAAEGK